MLYPRYVTQHDVYFSHKLSQRFDSYSISPRLIAELMKKLKKCDEATNSKSNEQKKIRLK